VTHAEPMPERDDNVSTNGGVDEPALVAVHVRDEPVTAAVPHGDMEPNVVPVQQPETPSGTLPLEVEQSPTPQTRWPRFAKIAMRRRKSVSSAPKSSTASAAKKVKPRQLTKAMIRLATRSAVAVTARARVGRARCLTRRKQPKKMVTESVTEPPAAEAVQPPAETTVTSEPRREADTEPQAPQPANPDTSAADSVAEAKEEPCPNQADEPESQPQQVTETTSTPPTVEVEPKAPRTRASKRERSELEDRPVDEVSKPPTVRAPTPTASDPQSAAQPPKHKSASKTAAKRAAPPKRKPTVATGGGSAQASGTKAPKPQEPDAPQASRRKACIEAEETRNVEQPAELSAPAAQATEDPSAAATRRTATDARRKAAKRPRDDSSQVDGPSNT
jgi:hypothetical protein